MDDSTLQPILAGVARHVLTAAGGALVTSGYIQSSDVAGIVGTGMVLLGVAWSWWQKEGQKKALAVGSALLQKLTATRSHAAAVEVAEKLPAPSPAAVAAKVTQAVQAITSVILAAVLLALAFPGTARAMTCVDTLNKLPIGCTPRQASPATATAELNTIMSAIAQPFQALSDFIASDAAGAATLATQVPALQDTNGAACWIKMQAAGAVFQAHPVPLTLKVMTDFESLRLLQMTANDLCAYTPCTVVFSDGANLAVAVASAVGGALTSNAVPSLTQLCARIPQLSPMLPQAVTGITPIPASAVAPAITPSPAATPAKP
jgi:hypothetical protein